MYVRGALLWVFKQANLKKGNVLPEVPDHAAGSLTDNPWGWNKTFETTLIL